MAKDPVYPEDHIHRSRDWGTFVLGVRNDAGTSLADADGDYIPLTVDANGNMHSADSAVLGELQAQNSLIKDTYDYIDLSYTGDNLTGVVFRIGGSGGTAVSTLTLAYTGARLDSVSQA